MSLDTTVVMQILTPFGSQQIHKGQGTMRFIARLIEAVKIFCFIQQLELFLHLGKPVDTAIPIPKELFSSHEVVKPDSLQDIAVNRREGIRLFSQLPFRLYQKCTCHRSTFLFYKSGTTTLNICSSAIVP